MSDRAGGPPWETGSMDLDDDVYDALIPLDGYRKGSRGGPRPYVYEDRWWVIISLSDFGDVLVGTWGPINQPTAEVSDAEHEPDNPQGVWCCERHFQAYKDGLL